MRRNSFGAILLSALMIFSVVTPSLRATQRDVNAARKPSLQPPSTDSRVIANVLAGYFETLQKGSTSGQLKS